MKKTLLAFTAAFLSAFAFAADAQKAKPFDATVGEFFTNPVGYSLKDLKFSWKLPAVKNGTKQTAYQIRTAKTPEELQSNPVWDSGKVQSDKSVGVPYGGTKLNSRDRLYWHVRFWDENGNPSDWSDVNFFEAGLLSNSEWKGKWIFSPQPRTVFFREFVDREIKNSRIPSDFLPPTYFRKSVEIDNGIKSARLYITCRGIIQFYINGKKVGNDFWGTGWTDYNKRIQTNTYDITKLVRNGENVFAAALGDGWYSGRIGFDRKKRGTYGAIPELLAQIEITFKDGSKKTVATDESWKWSFGPILFSDIYDGEIYDARKAVDGWNDTDFDDSDWKNSAAKNVEASPLLEPRRNQPIVVKDTLATISVKKLADGKYVFDLGQNMVGWPRIKFPACKDREITIRYAEMLNKDGSLYVANYRAAQSVDKYIGANKADSEIWEPLFTYHGFRYVELSNLPPNVHPTPDWVEGVVLYNDMPLTGSFVCSKPKVNILQSNIQWGQRGNFFSTPTDCPQRDERLGWTGDAQVFCPTAAYNMNVLAFFNKWLLDLADTAVDGCPAHVAPDMRAGRGSAAWSDAMVICPWEMYMAFGDTKILRENYSAMKGWVDYMKRTSKNLVRPVKGYGDWLQPNGRRDCAASDTPKDLIGTAYFARCAELLSKIAIILGMPNDAETYKDLSNAVKSTFMNVYVSPDGTVKSDSQTAYLLTLGFDIAPENVRAKIFDKLVKAIARDGNKLNTGFVGTPLLNQVLTRFGRMDLAYVMLNNECYPSWLYPINQGATTMWERWNSYSHEHGFGSAGMNSFNHYAYGAIGQWLYKDVAGLWYDPSAPGYKNIMFEPKPGGDLTFASASHETPFGTASSSWKLSDGIMEWTVLIPPNSTGTLRFPTSDPKSIRINGNPVDQKKFSTLDGAPSLSLPSGHYQILLK